MLRIAGRQRKEIARGWRKSYSEELRDIYFSPFIIRAVNSRIMKWAEHVTRIGEIRNSQTFLVVRAEGPRHLGVNGRILKWVLK
jgi:hypothetical protein